MRTLDVTKATGPLADYAREIKKGPVLLTRRGKPVAALVSVRNADAETLTLSTSPLFMTLIDRSRSRLKSEDSVSQGEIRSRLNIKRTVRSR
jgi:prevent-host-death family protein